MNDSTDSDDFNQFMRGGPSSHDQLISSTPVKVPCPTSLSVSSIDITVSIPRTKDFKVPRRPLKRKLKPTKVCPTCGKGYVCTKSYKTHVLTHKIHESAARYPNSDKILNNALDIAVKALETVSKAPAGGDRGELSKMLVCHVKQMDSVLWKDFVLTVCKKLLDGMIGSKFLLPSSLLKQLVDQVNNTLDNFSEELVSMLDLPDLFDSNLQADFVMTFVMTFAKELLVFIGNTVRAFSGLSLRNVELDQDDREVIYYIAGAIFHGYLVIARRYESSTRWSAIAQALKARAITDEITGDSSWTLELDNGGLIYVTEQCQDFCVAVTKVVYSFEQKDGSIDYSSVIKAVATSDILVMWDRMFGGVLPTDVSLNFMNTLIESICKVCGGGIAKKRLNNLRKGPVVSMPTRHVVATRRRV